MVGSGRGVEEGHHSDVAVLLCGAGGVNRAGGDEQGIASAEGEFPPVDLLHRLAAEDKEQLIAGMPVAGGHLSGCAAVIDRHEGDGAAEPLLEPFAVGEHDRTSFHFSQKTSAARPSRTGADAAAR